MKYEKLSTYLMLVLGSLLGLLSVVFFGLNRVIDFSPEIKSILLFSTSFILFLLSMRIPDPDLKKSIFVLAPTTYLVGLYHVINVLELGNLFNFLIIVFSSILFITISYINLKIRDLLDENYISYLVIVGVILTGLTAAYDLGSPDVQYSITFSNNTQLEEDDSQKIGFVVARNSYDFKKEFRPPEVRACIYPRGERVRVDVKHQKTGFIDGNSLVQSSMFVRQPSNQTMQSIPNELKIEERSSCEKNASRNILVVKRN